MSTGLNSCLQYVQNASKCDFSSIPVNMNEPLSFLQRISEAMQYPDLIIKAANAENSLQRMEFVAAFAVSSISCNVGRHCKPFNSLLGETFEYDDQANSGFRIVCEQISQNPPISAFHVDGGDLYQYYGSIYPKMKFMGKTLKVQPKGIMTLELLQHQEIYTWSNVPCHVSNLLIGTPTVEYIGEQQIRCSNGQYRCDIQWKESSIFPSKREPNRIEGQICLCDNGQPVRGLRGKWTERLIVYDICTEKCNKRDSKTSHKLSSNNLFNGSFLKFNKKTSSDDKSIDKKSESIATGSADNLSDSIRSSQDVLWEIIPLINPDKYKLSLFALKLIEWPIEENLLRILPPTDSRLRKDIRFLKDGDSEGAQKERQRLEENQRIREKSQDKIAYEPKWFTRQQNSVSGLQEWRFTGEYWKRDWTGCVNLFE